MRPGRLQGVALAALCLSLGAGFPGCAQETEEESRAQGGAAGTPAVPESWLPDGGDSETIPTIPTRDLLRADPGDEFDIGEELAEAGPAPQPSNDAPFDIRIAGETTDLESFFTSAAPGGEVRVALPEGAPAGDYALIGPDGSETAFAEGAATWRAPDAPGESRELIVRRGEGQSAAQIALRVFIHRPVGAMEGEYLNGYRIGAYPDEALRGLDIYEPPAGFIEVTAENQDMKVSPHFTLGQFLCHQQADHWPKYVLLEPRLILKLEALLADINDQGIQTDELFVMSGYRTPWYNRAIGNTTTYSRHVYGGAADIFVDVDPRDGDMDDLNGDDRVTMADAGWLFDRANALERSDEYRHLVGGLGKYDRNAAHGPFLHVDARGYEARW